MKPQTTIEQIKVASEDLLNQFEHIVHEANVRRIVIKHDGHTIAEFPVTAGVIGAALAPMLAAVSALAAALTHCTIEVERDNYWDESVTLSESREHEAARRELDDSIHGARSPRR